MGGGSSEDGVSFVYKNLLFRELNEGVLRV